MKIGKNRLIMANEKFDKPIDSYVKYYVKKRKRLGMKIWKLCFSKGYKYNMTVYLGKDGTRGTATKTRAHMQS
jgi:hypothetical protein